MSDFSIVTDSVSNNPGLISEALHDTLFYPELSAFLTDGEIKNIEDVALGMQTHLLIDYPYHGDFMLTEASGQTHYAKQFVTEITREEITKLGGDLSNTLHSPLMGVPPVEETGPAIKCTSCDVTGCAGHFGMITFPELILNPDKGMVYTLIDLLACICWETGHLSVPPGILEEQGIVAKGMIPKERIKRIAELTNKTTTKCVCGSCKKKVFDKKVSHAQGYVVYKEGDSDIIQYISPSDVHEMLSHLGADDVRVLGFSSLKELEKFTFVGIPVPPNNLRPVYVVNGMRKENEETVLLSKLVQSRNRWQYSLKLKDIKKNLLSIRIDTENVPTISEIVNAKNLVTKELDTELAEYDLKREDVESISEKRQEIGYIEGRSGRLSGEEKRKLGSLKEAIQAYNLPSSVVRLLVKKYTKETTLESQKVYLSKPEIKKLIDGRRFVASEDTIKHHKDTYKIVLEIFKNVGLLFASKSGVMREVVNSKRSDYTARAVVVPDVEQRLDETPISATVALRTGKSVIATPENVMQLNILLRQGQVRYIQKKGRQTRQTVNDAEFSKGVCHIQIGDTITRGLQDGDIGLFGRNPSLQRANLYSSYIRVGKSFQEKTMGFALAFCEAMGMDFDGDTAYMKIPQAEAAIREAIDRMMGAKNLINTRTGAPWIAIAYNAVKLWRVVTDYEQEYEDEEIMNYLTDMSYRSDMEAGTDLADYLRDFKMRCDLLGVEYNTGKSLFSMLLPDNFTYPADGRPNKNGLLIRNGIIISGFVTSTDIGTNSICNIPHYLVRHYSSTVASDFIYRCYRGAYYLGDRFAFMLGPMDYILKEDRQIETQYTELYKKNLKLLRDLGERPTQVYDQAVHQQSVDNILSSMTVLNENLYERIAAENSMTRTDQKFVGKIVARLRVINSEILDQVDYVTDRYVGDLELISEAGKKVFYWDEEGRIEKKVPIEAITREIYEQAAEDNNKTYGEIVALVEKYYRLSQGLYNSFYLGSISKTKGSKEELGTMMGSVGQIALSLTRDEKGCEERCSSSYRVGTCDPGARGYIARGRIHGLDVTQKCAEHKMARKNMVTQQLGTPRSGHVARELINTLSSYITRGGATVSQTGYLLECLEGGDGLEPHKIIHIDKAPVPYDPVAASNQVSSDVGWTLVDDTWYHSILDGEGKRVYVKY